MSTSRAKCDLRGFTLLELLVVIVLLGLLTATVTTRISATLAPAAMRQSISQLEFADQGLRLRAQRTGRPMSLRFEIGNNHFTCVAKDDGNDSSIPPIIRQLGQGVRITKVITQVQETTYGPASVMYDAQGGSESFAMELKGRGETTRWILIAGLTGQLSEVRDEAAVRQCFQTVLPTGLHAS